MRALRVDKLTYAALEATLAEYAAGRASATIPVQRMLTMGADEIRVRAEALAARLNAIDAARGAGGRGHRRVGPPSVARRSGRGAGPGSFDARRSPTPAPPEGRRRTPTPVVVGGGGGEGVLCGSRPVPSYQDRLRGVFSSVPA